jgi:hypothetical protein
MTRLPRALALATLLAAPGGADHLSAQQPTAAPSVPPAPADSSLLTPEGTIRAVYRLVSFGPGQQTDWAAVRTLFVPEAVIVLRNTRTSNAVFSLAGFIDDFVRFDTIPVVARNGFRESVVRLHATSYRDIAHVLVLYEAEVLNLPRPPQRGIDCWELVRREGRWWIVSVTNELVVPDAPLPVEITP